MYDDLFEPKKFLAMTIATSVLAFVVFVLPNLIEKLIALL
jgi:hypothetical protein